MKLKQLHQLTQSLGLTLNESEIYAYLLKAGQTTGTDIIEHTNLDKSSTYRALKSLIEKNLVYSVGQERNKLFAANPYEEVLKLADNQIEHLASTKKQLTELFADLEEYAQQQYQKNITIYKGTDGYKRFLESRLVEGNLIREIGSRRTIETYSPPKTKCQI